MPVSRKIELAIVSICIAMILAVCIMIGQGYFFWTSVQAEMKRCKGIVVMEGDPLKPICYTEDKTYERSK